MYGMGQRLGRSKELYRFGLSFVDVSALQDFQKRQNKAFYGRRIDELNEIAIFALKSEEQCLIVIQNMIKITGSKSENYMFSGISARVWSKAFCCRFYVLFLFDI